jgi:hypothetical protein
MVPAKTQRGVNGEEEMKTSPPTTTLQSHCMMPAEDYGWEIEYSQGTYHLLSDMPQIPQNLDRFSGPGQKERGRDPFQNLRARVSLSLSLCAVTRIDLLPRSSRKVRERRHREA